MSIDSISVDYVKLRPNSAAHTMMGWPYRLVGMALGVVSIAGWLTLLSWSVSDPSLSFATGAEPRNLLGPLGAIFSDLTLQMLGLAAIFVYLPPFVWGGQFALRENVPHLKTKLILFPLAILGLAGAFSSLPVVENWPLNHGYGGIIGDLVLGLATSLLSMINPQRAVIAAGMLYFAGGFAALFGALGLTQNELQILFQRPEGKRAGKTGDNIMSGLSFMGVAWAFTGLFSRGSAHGERSSRVPKGPEPGFCPADTDMVHGGDQGGWLPNAPDQSSEAGEVDALPRMFRQEKDELQPSLDFGDEHGNGARSFAENTERDSKAMAERFAPASAASKGAGGAQPGQNNRQDQESGNQNNDTRSTSNPGPAFLRTFRTRKQLASGYSRPSLNILKRAAIARPGPEYTQSVLRGNARLLEDVLGDFGIKGEIKEIKPGPVVTSFELEPARGTKSSRVIALADDIARSMSATSARVAVVPGRNAIGIELPNAHRDMVMLRELLEAPAYKSSNATLPLALGKSIGGEPIIADLARMPHLLVAGTTGSGKSVGVNAMILSLLYHLSPTQCRLLLIDPKMLELSVYNGIPHLLTPVVTDPHKAVSALGWAVREMEERYKRMSQLSVRNIEVFNNRVRNAKKRGEQLARTVQTGFDQSTGQAIYEREEFDLEPMAHIVIVVDEFADLMSVAGKEIEAHVQRLAQMARAAGIHLIMATQRPSVDIITGTIKANFPTRISFKVTSKIDSRTILNEQGAEQLLGHGDMLYSGGMGQISRVHGPFVSDEEVEQIAAYLRCQGEPEYVNGITDDGEQGGGGQGSSGQDQGAAQAGDDLYDKAVAIVIRDQKASTSYIQRRLSIGYNRAADLIERMEQAGLISPAGPTGKRQILVGESNAAQEI